MCVVAQQDMYVEEGSAWAQSVRGRVPVRNVRTKG
jgi:hypothetical protein